MNATADNHLMTLEDILVRLRVSRSTIYTLMARRGFPRPYKIGSGNRWPSHEVEEWLLAQRRAEIGPR